MKKELYLEQQLHASILVRALENHGAALDASETGCGKTLVNAEIAAQFRRPTFVVCLKNSIPMWKAEMAERGWPAIGVINYELLRRGKTPWGKWGVGEIFTWNLPKNSLIIWDEVHKCQGMDSQNSKMLIAAKSYWNLLLSATAVENPTEMKALGYVLGLHNLRGFWQWCKLRGCAPNQWKGLDFTDIDGKHMKALHTEIFPEHGSRLTVADLKEHFAETQIITTPIDFGPEIEKIYEAMESEIGALEEIMTSDSKHPAAEKLVAQLRARQKAELCKVPVMIEMAEDLLREHRSVVIFVNFDATIEALLARLTGAEIIRGGQNATERNRVMDSFQNNTCRLLICNIQAGGTSINLHDIHGGHPRTSLISPSWNIKEVLQAMGRIHRAGGMTPSQQHVLYAAHTVETKVEKVLREKMRNVTIFNTGQELPDNSWNDLINQNSASPAERKNPNHLSTHTTPESYAPAPTILKTVDDSNDMNQTNEPVKPPETDAPDQEPAHAKYNPSSLSLWEKCPGYLNREGTNEAAERGTRIHDALEKDAIDSLDPKERPTAQVCKDFIDSLIEERRPALPEHDYREIRMKMDLGNEIDTFGTCDRLLIYGSHGIMIDYKSGYRAVADAELNAQGWAYVIGAFQKFKFLDTIEFFFLIPNRDEVSFHTFKRSDVPAMMLRLNTIIRRAMEADPKLYNPQPELCEYCLRQATCPALASKALSAAAELADGLPLPTSMLVDESRPDDVPKILRLAPIFKEWAETVKKEALRLNLEEGLEFDGFERRERKNPRGVTSVVGTWELVKEKGVSLEDFLLACGTISIPELEDLVAANAKRGEKGKAKKQLEKDLRASDLLREESKYYFLAERKK